MADSDHLATPLRRRLHARSRHALLGIFPALTAALILQGDVSPVSMFFGGGRRMLALNISEAILLPYMGLFLLALGTLVMPAPPTRSENGIVHLDASLIRFFAGAGLAVVGGFVLGLMRLLVPWVTIPLFIGVLYLYLLNPESAALFRCLGEWMAGNGTRAAGLQTAVGLQRCLVVLLRAVFLLVLGCVVLTKGLLPDACSADVMPFYFSYFAEVRHQHGIWMDRAHPIIADFLAGRGNGVHLFFASFTPPCFIQLVSVMYLVALVLIVRRVVMTLLPYEPGSIFWTNARRLLPDCAMLLALCSPILMSEMGKYHLQTGAFLMFLSWGGLLYLFLDRQEARWLLTMMLPAVAAFSIAIAQAQALAVPILVASGLAVGCSRGFSFAKHHVLLAAAGIAVAALSLAFNWAYVGVLDVSPASLSQPLRNDVRLQNWWSVDMLQYVQLAQGYHVATNGLSAGRLASHVLGLFSLPVELLQHVLWTTIGLRWAVCLAVFLFVVFRLRASVHLAVLFAAVLLLTVVLETGGLNAVLTRDRVAEFGWDRLALLANPAWRRPVNTFLLVSYTAVLLYLLLFALRFVRAVLGAVRWRWPGRLLGRSVPAFMAVFLSYYALEWVFTSLTNRESMQRLFAFGRVYPAVAFMCIFTLVTALLSNAVTIRGDERHMPCAAWPVLMVWVLAGWWIVGRAVSAYFGLTLSWIAHTALVGGLIGVGLLLGPRFDRRLGDLPASIPGIRRRAGTALLLSVVFASLFLAAHGFRAFLRWHDGRTRQSFVTTAARYFLGRVGLADTIRPDRWDFRRCLRIENAVPGSAPVLLLNAEWTMSNCYESPLLPRGKVVHLYQSVLTPGYRALLTGSAVEARAVLRQCGMEYFLVLRGNSEFWGPGCGEAFNPESLQTAFDVSYEDDEFLVLTWRGMGKRPVSSDVSVYIENLRSRGRAEMETYRGWLGHARYKEWLAQQPRAWHDDG